jgi:hypothetical protein
MYNELTRRLTSNALEYVVDEGVEDSHSFVGNASIRMNLLEDCIYRISARLRHCDSTVRRVPL